MDSDFPDWDETALHVTCPKCSKTSRKTLRWIKDNSQFECAGCGAVVLVPNRDTIVWMFKLFDTSDKDER